MVDIRVHYMRMKEALRVAETALTVQEVPVGCILVYKNTIIARSFNQTNLSLNGTKHAEFEAYDQVRALYPDTYRDIFRDTVLYVTVEPCIMCASLLRQLEIKLVVFGCPNERFGGNGSIFTVNKDTSHFERPYKVIPGVLSREAVTLLRKFYLLENSKSPTSKDKKHRRLELNEFPPIDYSRYLERDEFQRAFGEEFGFVFDSNLFLEFDENGSIVNESKNKRIKT